MNQLQAYPVANTLPTLPTRVQHLVDTLSAQPTMSPEIARDCILHAAIEPEDLMSWADFDHPVSDSYGRKLVYDGGHFEVMVMSWCPGDFSAIHDHGAAEWGAVQSFGLAEHCEYHLENQHLSMLALTPFRPRTVVTVAPELIHQMGNPGNTQFLSLHVYGSTQVQGAITGGARIFDLLERSIQRTDGGVFYCLPEAEITMRTWGLTADRNTMLRHHHQMLDRIYWQITCPGNTGRLLKTAQLLREELAALESFARVA